MGGGHCGETTPTAWCPHDVHECVGSVYIRAHANLCIRAHANLYTVHTLTCTCAHMLTSTYVHTLTCTQVPRARHLGYFQPYWNKKVLVCPFEAPGLRTPVKREGRCLESSGAAGSLQLNLLPFCVASPCRSHLDSSLGKGSVPNSSLSWMDVGLGAGFGNTS